MSQKYKNDRSGGKKREKILTGKKKIEKFKNNLWVKDDRKQTDHRIFKSDFNNCEMKIQTKDRMDETLEMFTLRTIVNKTSRSTENDWTNLTFVDLDVH